MKTIEKPRIELRGTPQYTSNESDKTFSTVTHFNNNLTSALNYRALEPKLVHIHVKH